MKKTIVALAVAAFAATSANATTVFNQDGTKVDVKGSFRVLLAKEKDQRFDLREDGSNLEFMASHDIGNGLSALGNAKIKLTEQLTLDKLYAGFKFDGVGQLTFGKQGLHGAGFSDYTYKFGGVDLVELPKAADVENVFVAPQVTGQQKLQPVVIGVPSGDKVVSFESADFNGFSFSVDYAFDQSSAKDKVNNTAFVLGAAYKAKFDELSVGLNAAYGRAVISATHTITEQGKADIVTIEKETAKAFTIGSELGYGPVKFALDYSQAKVDEGKTKAIGVGVNYQATDDLKVYTVFQNKKTTVAGKLDKKERTYALGVGYNLHKNVETFLEAGKTRTANYDVAGKATKTSQSKVFAGFRVHF